jgi:AraC-like DNA-binding protein
MSDSIAAPDNVSRAFGPWCGDRLSAYDPAGQGLKVKEESVIPLDAGTFRVDADVANFGDVSLLRVGVGGKAMGTTVLDPDYLAFAIPVSWAGEYFINGELACRTSIYLAADTTCVHVRGGRRLTLGVVLPRTAFIETVAALRGVEPEVLTAADRLLTHTPTAASELRRRIGAVIEASGADHALSRPPQEMAHEVFGLMTDAYLAARPGTTPKGQPIRQPDRIVRKAEERFMAAEGVPVSLADLCAAAGVSKSTLYLAFDRVCGQPPLQYFHKRRLTRARLHLLESPPWRGAVKRVALETGFTELGRFAGEYRRLFGEAPSATLTSSSG